MKVRHDGASSLPSLRAWPTTNTSCPRHGEATGGNAGSPNLRQAWERPREHVHPQKHLPQQLVGLVEEVTKHLQVVTLWKCLFCLLQSAEELLGKVLACQCKPPAAAKPKARWSLRWASTAGSAPKSSGTLALQLPCPWARHHEGNVTSAQVGILELVRRAAPSWLRVNEAQQLLKSVESPSLRPNPALAELIQVNRNARVDLKSLYVGPGFFVVHWLGGSFNRNLLALELPCSPSSQGQSVSRQKLTVAFRVLRKTRARHVRSQPSLPAPSKEKRCHLVYLVGAAQRRTQHGAVEKLLARALSPDVKREAAGRDCPAACTRDKKPCRQETLNEAESRRALVRLASSRALLPTVTEVDKGCLRHNLQAKGVNTLVALLCGKTLPSEQRTLEDVLHHEACASSEGVQRR